MEKRNINLDHHTRPFPCQTAFEQMKEASERRFCLEERARLEEPLVQLAGASDEYVFSFTSSGAEAIGQVIWSVFSERARKEGKTHFIASCVEDAPTLQMLKRCEELGCSVKIAPVDKMGRIDIEKLAELITPRTALLSFSTAQGLTGVIQPMEEISKLAKEKGVLLHLDASYSFGKIVIPLDADYLTFSGERIHSVQSSAGLFAKKSAPLIPFVLGANFDFPSFAALSASARLASLALDAMGLETARLRDLLEGEILRRVPDATVLFQDSPRLPNTTTLLFPRAHSDALSYFLERKGLYPNVSGAYCQKLDRVLSASQIQTESSLSFSLSRMTSEEEVIRAAELISESVLSLQTLSEDLYA